jgi:hypothetical protein
MNDYLKYKKFQKYKIKYYNALNMQNGGSYNIGKHEMIQGTDYGYDYNKYKVLYYQLKYPDIQVGSGILDMFRKSKRKIAVNTDETKEDEDTTTPIRTPIIVSTKTPVISRDESRVKHTRMTAETPRQGVKSYDYSTNTKSPISNTQTLSNIHQKAIELAYEEEKEYDNTETLIQQPVSKEIVQVSKEIVPVSKEIVPIIASVQQPIRTVSKVPIIQDERNQDNEIRKKQENITKVHNSMINSSQASVQPSHDKSRRNAEPNLETTYK